MADISRRFSIHISHHILHVDGKNVLSFAAQKQIAIICQLANRVFFSRSRIGMGFFSGLLPVCVRVIVIKINKWLSVSF